MKNILKRIFILFIFLPTLVLADRTFEDGVNKANKYVYTISEYNKFFNTNENLPYIYDESGLSTSTRFTKGGFLNEYELNITSSNSEEKYSYLTPGIEFWLANEKRVNTKVISDSTLTSGVRVTEFLSNGATVSGKGTSSKPWELQYGYTITIGSNNKSYGTVSPTTVANIEKNSERTYTFVINTVNGFDYNLDNCTKGVSAKYATITEKDKTITVSNVTGNVSCYVKFIPKCLKISFDDQNGGYKKGYQGQYYYLRYGVGWYADSACTIEKDIVLPSNLPYKKGYIFEGYYTGKTLDNKGIAFITKDNLIEIKTTTLKEDSTIYAVWTPREYTLYYSGYNNHAKCSDCTNTKTVTYDQTYGYLYTPVVDSGYTFNGWKIDNHYVTKDSIVSPNNAEVTYLTLNADITANEYKITYDAKGGTVTPKSKTVTFDSNVGTLPTPSYEGYTFKGWYDSNGNLYTSSTKYQVVGNITLYAKYNKCTSGYYCPGNNEELICKAGTYSGEGAKECTPCSKGYYSSKDGSTSCDKCASGTYNTLEGQTSCSACDKGYYCTGGTNKTECPKGTYRNSTGGKQKSDCISCDYGTYSNTTGTITCSKCNAGEYQDERGKTSCKSCDAGTYSSSKGASSCEKCKVGSFQPDQGKTSCIKCAEGSYQNNEGKTSCIACASGKTSTKGSSSCSDCSNKSNVSSWNVASWTNNTTSNVCSISSCNTGYSISSNSCVANTYYIKYNANNGSGTMNNTTCTYDQTCTLTSNAFTRSGYTFSGWATSASGSVTYSNGASVTNLAESGTYNLYAVWKENSKTKAYTTQGTMYSWMATCSKKCTSNKSCSINHCCSAGIIAKGKTIWVYQIESGNMALGYVYYGNFDTKGAGYNAFYNSSHVCVTSYGFKYGTYGYGGPEDSKYGYSYIYVRFPYYTDEYGARQYLLKDSNGNYFGK